MQCLPEDRRYQNEAGAEHCQACLCGSKTGKKVTWSCPSPKSPLPAQQIEKSSCLDLLPFLPMAERRRVMKGMQSLSVPTLSVGLRVGPLFKD